MKTHPDTSAGPGIGPGHSLHRVLKPVLVGTFVLSLPLWWAAGGGRAPATASPTAAETAPQRSIPFDQLGAEAQKQYSGDGISIIPTPGGAQLRAAMQALQGHATPEGLWLTSTAQDDPATAPAVRFRVRAAALHRATTPAAPPPVGVLQIPSTGIVHATDDVATFARPGLVEEYRVSMDGVRQDFLVPERPSGEGRLAVTLDVTGARATSTPYGAKLTLDGSGREIAYSRLHVTDATGRELTASLSVPAEDRMCIEVDDRGALYPVRIDPTFSDADWTRLGAIPGTDGTVFALAVDGTGNLYVGGDFAVAGEAAANNVAKWNGSTWSALGAGTNNNVTALAVIGTDLYAGGTFTTAGGVSASRIAKWDGSTWSALGSGTSGPVGALSVSGSDLYAGGDFTTAGGVSANYVAKWNGTSWSALGSGTGFRVYALLASGPDLYVGGSFTAAGGSSANRVAKWNGTSWSALGTGLNGTVRALALSGGSLYVGGSFSTAGGSSAANVAKWDGSAWSAMGSGVGGFSPTVYSLAVSGTDVIAGGSFSTAGGSAANYVAKWNGTSWSPLGTGADFTVEALLVSGGSTIAGGSFRLIGGVIANSVASWSGSAWSGLGSAMDARVLALALSGSDLYAGGEFTTAGNFSVNYIAKWNGSTWSPLGSGMDALVRTLAVSGTDVYAGGDFTTAGGVTVNHVAKWNGTSWSALSSGMNWNVHALAISDLGQLYAGGDFTTAGGNSASRVAQWNGTTWIPLGSGTGGLVHSILTSGTDVYVGGGFSTAGGSSIGYGVAKWDGASWSALGSGTNNTVYAMVMLGGQLHIGGSFTQAGGSTVNYIARWNGSSWSGLGTGMNAASGVNALAVSGTDLIAGGAFNTAGGVSIGYGLARWNGTAWSSLGTGTNSIVRALAASSTELYAGGDFYYAFGSPAWAFIARARNLPDIAVEQPSGTGLVDGSSTVSFGSVLNGGTTTREFTVRNTGSAELTGLGTSFTGGGAARFSVTTGPTAPVAAGAFTTFTVTFAPSGVGTVEAALHISSNDPDESPFDITLSGTSLNNPPTISDIGDATSPANGSTGALAFTVGDVETAPGSLTLSAASSNPSVVPQANIVFGGSGADRTVTITPAANQLGTAYVTITVSDGTLTAQDGFFVEVNDSGTVFLGATSFVVQENVPGGVLLIPVQRTPGAAGDATVRISTANGTAIAGAPPGGDFTGKTNEVVSLPEGTTLVNVPITIHNPPSTNESHETFTVTLSSPTVTSLGSPISATVRIMDSVDTLSPTAPVITAPLASELLKLATGATFELRGSASDNKGIVSVAVDLNGTGPVNAALSAPGMPSTAWSRTITPRTGLNSISVQSTDTFGRTSTILTRSFTVLRPLRVIVSGGTLGSVTPGFTDPSYREVGKSFTVAAIPKSPTPSSVPPFLGALFTGWTIGGVDVANGGALLTDADAARVGTTASSLLKSSLTFIFREGMTLTATFVANPYTPMAGTYYGLIRPSGSLPDRSPTGFGPEDGSPQANSTVGFFKATLQSTGAFSGTLTIDATVLNFAGAFDHNGDARFGTARLLKLTVPRVGKPSLILSLQTSLGAPGSYDQITGTVTVKDFRQSVDLSVSDVESNRAWYNGTTRIPDSHYLLPGNANGVFTAVMPALLPYDSGDPSNTQVSGLTAQDYPQGDGIGTVTITKAGLVTYAGTLADGTTVSASSALSQQDTFPLFAQLYNKLGFVSGFAQLAWFLPSSDIAMADHFQWLRPLQTTSHYYPAGWPSGIKLGFTAAAYTTVNGQSPLKAPDGPDPGNSGDELHSPDEDGNLTLTFADGQLTEPLVKSANLSTADLVTKVPDNDPTFTLKITRSTGVFGGTFIHTNDTIPEFKGIIYQKGPSAGGYGWFLTRQPNPIDYTGESGGVTMIGRP